jgi:hypothetical protein
MWIVALVGASPIGMVPIRVEDLYIRPLICMYHLQIKLPNNKLPDVF